jgi:hypothetical protein
MIGPPGLAVAANANTGARKSDAIKPFAKCFIFHSPLKIENLCLAVLASFG